MSLENATERQDWSTVFTVLDLLEGINSLVLSLRLQRVWFLALF